jgi:hypothetical protein
MSRDDAERNRLTELLAKKMQTPPPDPFAPPPPTSYERFTELAEDIQVEADSQAEARNETAKEIWGE